MQEKLYETNIRPHLVPFLYQMFEGKKANYQNITSKSIKIYKHSSFGKYLKSQIKGVTDLKKNDEFIIYLTITRKSITTYNGTIYISVSNSYQMLLLPQENIININNFLEDLFRNSFQFFVEGCKIANPKYQLKKIIELYIEKYDLLEYEFSIETLRRLFYRSNEKNEKFSRFQIQSANRVIGN